MGLLDKLLRKWKPLSWFPPVAPSCDAPLCDKLEWLEACNEDMAIRLGGDIFRIATAFSACEHIMEALGSLLENDKALSSRGVGQQARSDAIHDAIMHSCRERQSQEITFYYWQIFGTAYGFACHDNGFVEKITAMSRGFDMMPHIFTQGVLELACRVQGRPSRVNPIPKGAPR